MKTVLLPVKDFANAKFRLAGALDPESRSGLAKAMLCDVLDALSDADVDRVVVYTASAAVAQVVRPFGFDIVDEPRVSGHSAAVNHMLPILCSTAPRVLVVASDLPRLTADEINAALDAACESIAIFPSHDGSGTNGMLFVPPAVMEMEYGTGSLARHVARAQAGGYNARVLEIAGIAFDIDTPDDLAAFWDEPRLDSETWRYLRETRTRRVAR